MNEAPHIIDALNARFVDVGFLKNDSLYISSIQTFDEGDYRGHTTTSYVADLDGSAPRQLTLPGAEETSSRINLAVPATIVSVLPRDPRRVLVQGGRDGSFYLLDVKTLQSSKVLEGSDRFFGYQVDLSGTLRARLTADFDNGKVYIAQQIRNADTGAWEEHFRTYAKDRIDTSIFSFTSDPNVVLIATNKDSDKTGVYEYDLKQRKILEPAFEHKLFEADGAMLSYAPGDFGQPLGFMYRAETDRAYWSDDYMRSVADQLTKALGEPAQSVDWTDPGSGAQAKISVATGARVEIASMSDDKKVMVIKKSGPSYPPQFYLLTDGKTLAPIAKSRPWVDTTALGDMQLVEYTARDGLVIPAFLTTPPKAVFGPGPYPTLVEPHGGPWARDDMDWDDAGWVQYFASHGYAVLQPQFRGSAGWGQKLWRAGDNEWGQKMSDDNDDGVKWLIGQHIADPGRVAIFGYSYGGYAALAAAIRPGGVYQCAISGAGVGDPKQVASYIYDDRYYREYQEPAVGGVDLLAHVADVKMPILLYHGDRDQVVDIKNSREFAAKLKAAGKPYRYVEIPDMGHTNDTWTPAMAEQQLTEIDSFLKAGCKAGGL